MAAANTDKFKKAKRRFSTTIGVGGIAAGATTLPLTTTTGLDTDTAVTLVIEPGTADEEVITGVVSGSNIINCVRGKEGTNDIVHNAGDAVSMYFTETHWDDLINGILVSHNQDGTLANNVITTASITDGVVTNAKLNTDLQQGWINLNDSPDTITYNGNRNYDLVYNSTDLSSTLSPGMKLKLTRTVAAPDKCTTLNGTNQYFSKTSPSGITFTDSFTCMAWVKLSSYGQLSTIISRRNAGVSGWGLRTTTLGQPEIYGGTGSAFDLATAYESIPLNKWVHIAATMIMSTQTVTIYIDGIAVTTGYTNSAAGSITQSGDLLVGASAAGEYFPGQIAQAAVFSSVLSQSTIRSYISQSLSGSESTLVSGFTLDETLNDLNTTNANNLTAQNSAATNTADSPFADAKSAGLQEYAVVNNVTYSTNTTVNVRVPFGCMIPTTGGISASYSAISERPYGLPYFSNVLGMVIFQTAAQTTTSGSYVDIAGMQTTVYVPPNAKIKIRLYCPRFAFSANGGSSLTIREGSTGLAATVRNGSSLDMTATTEYLGYPSTGSHTYKASLASNVAGTLTAYGSRATSTMDVGPMYFTVELV